jgi:hypothetical protein
MMVNNAGIVPGPPSTPRSIFCPSKFFTTRLAFRLRHLDHELGNLPLSQSFGSEANFDGKAFSGVEKNGIAIYLAAYTGSSPHCPRLLLGKLEG